MINYNEYKIAKDYIRRNDYKNALIILRKLYKYEPDDYVLTFELAKLLIKENETKTEGKKILINLINTCNDKLSKEKDKNSRINPKKIKKCLSYVTHELGKLEFEEGNIPAAVQYFQESLFYGNKYSLYELGKIEKERGNKEKAKEYFKRLSINNDCFAIYELGLLAKEEDNIKEALQYFEESSDKGCVLAITDLFKSILYCVSKEEFELANKYLQDNYDKFKIININSIYIYNIRFYVKFKLGLLTQKDIEDSNSTYFTKNLLNYNEKEVIDHIKSHYEEKDNGKYHSKFDDSINIDELYQNVKELINNMDPISSNLSDKYIIDYDYTVGKVNNIETNRLYIATYPHTKNIIIINPVLPDFIYDKNHIKLKTLDEN